MSSSIFHSPFTTALSGSARETEDRIRNIFQYQKKRPPVPALLLACALALSCGGLVSCESPNAPSSDPADASSQQAGFSLDARAQELVQALTPEDLPETTVEQTWSHTLDREVLLDALAQGGAVAPGLRPISSDRVLAVPNRPGAPERAGRCGAGGLSPGDPLR